MIIAEAVSPPWWYLHVTFGIAVLGAGLSVYNAWMAGRARVGAKRKESPYFPTGEIQVEHPKIRAFSPPTDGSVPYGYPEGNPVLIRALNKGGEARYARVDLLASFAEGRAEYRIGGDAEQICIYYPYSKARRGSPERFTLHYETASGVKGEQTFEHLHGLPELRRVSIK